MLVLRLLVVSVILCFAVLPAAATVLDPEWTEVSWLPTVSQITGMAWAPDGSGRLFLTRKGGEIRIVNAGPPPALVATPFATVTPIYTGSECGLIGLAFDPDFLSNGYLYVFASVSSGEQQVIRYTAVGNVGTDKTVLIAGLPTVGANHDGGAVGIGRDGKLYWAIGDQGSGIGVDGNLTSLAAKVGRANLDGSVPVDNPFVDGAGGNNDYIFARGLRNPFTFTFQPATGLLWVDSVGTSYEQVFAMASGDHAGWNDYENTQPAGFVTPLIKYRTNGVDVRNIVAAGGATRLANLATFTTNVPHGFRQGENITIAGVADPGFDGQLYVASTPTATTFKAWQVGPDTSSGGGTATTLNQGGAITGGTFYDASGAPAAYRQNYFYGDYNTGRVMRAVIGPGTSVTSVDYFATANISAIDVSVGPDGALYYVGHGGTIRRTSYNAPAQGIIVSDLHVWMSEGRSAVLSVRLATPADATVTIARTSGSSEVDVTGGAVLTFTTADYAVPQTVTLSSVADLDAIADTAYFSVSSSGLSTEIVEALVADAESVAGGFIPGRVPDGNGVAGPPLTIGKGRGKALDLRWGASCTGTAADYSVHEGILGSWYSHDAIRCTTGSATETTIVPGTLNHYYLVVALDAAHEGSYGTSSIGERPSSIATCRPLQELSACP